MGIRNYNILKLYVLFYFSLVIIEKEFLCLDIILLKGEKGFLMRNMIMYLRIINFGEKLVL